MGRRKHVWGALYDELFGESPSDPRRIQNIERVIEGASIEDFIDEVYTSIDTLRSIVESTQNKEVLLGIDLVMREIQIVLDNRITQENV